jgi:hypothetical protein
MRMGMVALWMAPALMAVLSGFMGAPTAADEPILTVVGLPGGETTLTLDEIRAMEAVDLRTGTPWTYETATFTGVTGRRFVEALGARGSEVVADALNDYHVAIPFDVFASDTTLIAYARDGAPMPVRDKGPLWVMFPFDTDPLYSSDSYKTYAIWSLYRLEFR